MNSFDTVREALEAAKGLHVRWDEEDYAEAIKALAAIEADHAHDLASAAAQGFREGVASVTAGQELVQLDHIACIDDGELRYMTGRKAPAYDCELYAMPDGKRAPKLYAAPVAQQATCRDLTDDDMDKIATLLGDQERGDIGYQGLCDKIIGAFANPVAQQQCHKRANDYCRCSRKAMLCDGAGPAQQPQAEAVPPVPPMQPVAAADTTGVMRFRANAIVKYLLDTHPAVDMNVLASKDFTNEDRRQFAQLIGYSVGGYCSLSYVDDAAADAALSAQGAKP